MNKALFLDRDGVINIEKRYVHRIEDFDFVDGIFDMLRFFQTKGYLIVIITNQAGIARGYYTEDDFYFLTDWMVERFEEEGIHISKVYFCPYHSEHGIGIYKKESVYRKPNPGMILDAKMELDIDLTKSILLGDKESDIKAGINAGVGINVLLDNNTGDVATKASYRIKELREMMEVYIKACSY